MSKLHGDVTEADKKLEQDLIGAEAQIEGLRGIIPAPNMAKCWVALAHDYYHDLGIDEEGDRLLLKALKDCPTYFKVEIIQHQKDDPQFDIVVNSLIATYLGNRQFLRLIGAT